MKRGGLIAKIEFFVALALISLNSCAVYHQKPINDAAVEQSLTPPNLEVVRMQAREIKHPILKPIDFGKGRRLIPAKGGGAGCARKPYLKSC